MMRGMVMMGHVGMGRLITAKCGAAGLAGSQVHPVAANFNTFFAYQFFSKLQAFDFLDMITDFSAFHKVAYFDA